MLINDHHRVFLSFFCFGLLNNILYVVILSAAIDLVGLAVPKAIVLLADIVPAFAIKILAPFFIHLIPYKARVWVLVGLSLFGMLVISLSPQHAIFFKVFGIALASVLSGMGEVSFLQLTHFYREQYSVGGFSTGTGGAGLLGSFLFMLLTNLLNMPVRAALLLFSVVPLGFVAAFYLLLPSPSEEIPYTQLEPSDETSLKNHVLNTLDEMKPLVRPYMVPLCTVYISEYVINQGVSPTLLFPLEDLPHWLFSSYRDIYVVYGFLYQLGVFVSRSSVNFGIRIKQLYWLTFLQAFNVFITVCQSLYDRPFPTIWPLLLLIFYEGLLGGFSYVNTFMSVSEQVPKHKREFSMGCVGISDSFGIVMAGCINWWLETNLCHLQVQRGRDWCATGSG